MTLKTGLPKVREPSPVLLSRPWSSAVTSIVPVRGGGAGGVPQSVASVPRVQRTVQPCGWFGPPSLQSPLFAQPPLHDAEVVHPDLLFRLDRYELHPQRGPARPPDGRPREGPGRHRHEQRHPCLLRAITGAFRETSQSSARPAREQIPGGAYRFGAVPGLVWGATARALSQKAHWAQ